MSIDLLMSVLTCVEFLLWSTAGFIFWKKGLHGRFRAMGVYLALRIAATPALIVLLQLQTHPGPHQSSFYAAYFYSYWSVYLASAVLLYFLCVEVFRSVFASFPGLIRLGTVVFGWAAFLTVVLSMSVVTFDHPIAQFLCYVAPVLIKVVGMILLCLLALLCIVMKTLNLSAKDRRFGVMLGFGLLSAGDFMLGSFVGHAISLVAPLQFVNEFITLFSLSVWIVYFVLPEPKRKPLVLPANSAIYRWNEIASALGHSTQVAMVQPAKGFFLSDVEKVVDKVLARNLQSSETKP